MRQPLLPVCKAMRKSDFDYPLPDELIAQYPLPGRSDSRLLALMPDGGLCDRQFKQLPELLHPGDLLIFNNTRVIPARLHGYKESGGAVEVMIERITDHNRATARVRASKSPRAGVTLKLAGGAVVALVEGRDGELFRLRFAGDMAVEQQLLHHGEIPLPPYIGRRPEESDSERYQTVYSHLPGAVAAPTAGLHFDRQLLDRLAAEGVGSAYVTLHVGAGTFQPMRVEEIEHHKMHSEWYEVGQEVCDQIAATRARGGRVVAVGTTAVRSLESAAVTGSLEPVRGETSLFITPGYRFRVVDAMITNFHLPQSTLLMLVSAFAGTDRILDAYRHAVESRYRFFSYGDAMWLERTGSWKSNCQGEPHSASCV